MTENTDNKALTPLAEENGNVPRGTTPDDIGRKIDEFGGFELDFKPDRTREDIHENRPGERLREKILALPESPGVYMYLDKTGKVIYVGKAKRLKRRVSSYFNRRHESVRTNLLVRSIVDMRFIVVNSEEEALNLENAMIKEYQPRYNVLLKDDKSYPWIVVTSEPFPRIYMTRSRDEKGKYYGPYTNVQAAKTVLQLIRDLFPVRSCKHVLLEDKIADGKYRLCLDYHIKKCGAPCCGLMSREKYNEYISRARQILNGETVGLQKYLRDEMARLSDLWKFEDAQAVKEQYEQVAKYNAKTVIGDTEGGDIDVFGYDDTPDAGYINYMHLHKGAVVQSLNLEYRRRLDETPAELLSMAIAEIGKRFGRTFTKVLVPFEPDVDFDNVEFIVPKRGDRRRTLSVAERNAQQYRADKEKLAEQTDPERGTERLMERMKADFRLNVQPRHIECFDNSNIQGTNPVASCVVFRNGKPSKRDYRHFIIKTVVGADDFASMKEVLHRRYSRMIAEGEPLPQLVVVDGGKGQLNAAVEAFDELGIRGEVALIGIAKRLEEIYFPGDSLPIYIDKKSQSLRVIQALRDEAHRFGITHHRLRRSKSQTVSELDNIKGIGEATAALLMKRFRSVARLKKAPLEDIVEAVGRHKGMLIYNHFHPEENVSS